jgi:limonene-1,2-epoxide hydrolase
MANEETAAIVREYYDAWKDGHAKMDEAKLLRVLADDVVVETPMRRITGPSELVAGISRFARTLKGISFIQTIATGTEASAVYDCALTAPVDTLRCAEFFRIEGGRIKAIRLVFDATEYRKTA